MTSPYANGIPIDPPSGEREAPNGCRYLNHRIVVIQYGADGDPWSAVVLSETDESRAAYRRHDDKRPPVWTSRAWYEFERSRSSKSIYWHMTGCGGTDNTYAIGEFVNPVPPPALLWIAHGVRVVTRDKRGRPTRPLTPATILRHGYKPIDEPLRVQCLVSGDGGHDRMPENTVNPFAISDGDTPCVYCPKCDDWMPDENESLCEHLAWCDKCGMVVMLVGKTGHRDSDNPRGTVYRHAI